MARPSIRTEIRQTDGTVWLHQKNKNGITRWSVAQLGGDVAAMDTDRMVIWDLPRYWVIA